MPSSTQSVIPVSEIRDGVIVQKSGKMNSILLVSSTNFGLKSTEEQQAILMNFGQFLNSLEIDIQIFVQSRKFNINPYTDYVSVFLDKQVNELVQIQVREYISFIKSFVEKTDVISKTFFLVISYTPTISKKKGGSIFGFFSKKSIQEEIKTFQNQRTQIAQRTSFIQQGLQSVGLRSSPLSSEGLIDVLYKSFNPGDTQSPSSAL